MIFKSKKDLLVSLLLWIPLLTGTGYAFFMESYFGGSLLMGVIVLFAWIWSKTYYRLNKEELIIYCGPFVEKVKLSKVESVGRTKKIFSAAAHTYEKLEIRHDNILSHFVAPEDEELFIEELKKRCKKAEFFL